MRASTAPAPASGGAWQQRRRLLALIPLALAGCGFRRRSADAMPFSSIALVGFAPRSPMAEALTQALSQVVRVETDPRRAQVQLQAQVDARERSVVATTAAAQVREQQLRVRLRWRVLAADGRELSGPAELVLARDMSYNEAAALAKAYEAESLYADMQNDLVGQVMRRLSRLVL